MAFQQLLRMWRDYLRDRRAAFAPLTAVALVALIIAGGTAVDTTRLYRTKDELQNIADGAALAVNTADVLRKIRQDIPVDRDAIARAYLAQIANSQYLNLRKYLTDYPHLSVRAWSDNQGEHATVKIEAVYKTVFGMFLLPEVPLTVQATTTLPSVRLEIALVLDVTTSMLEPSGSSTNPAEKKIESLRASARALVDGIAAFPHGSAKIAVVPFGKYVKIADEPELTASFRNSNNWFDTTSPGVLDKLDSADDRRKSQTECVRTCTRAGVGTYQACIRWRADPTRSEARVCEQYETRHNCAEWGAWHACEAKWYGCLGSRDPSGNLHLADDQDANNGKPYPMMWNARCGPKILPLTQVVNNQAGAQTVRNMIANLTVEQSTLVPTYLPAGVTWGWNVLTKAVPFADAEPYDTNNKLPRKILIFMTDGENQRGLKSPWDGTHDTGPSSRTDSDTMKLCSNVKEKKIEVFTVAFRVTPGSPGHTILRSCASATDHYFDAQDAGQLRDAFEAILQQIRNLTLSG